MLESPVKRRLDGDYDASLLIGVLGLATNWNYGATCNNPQTRSAGLLPIGQLG
jgi:hypothetical protein